MKSKKKVKSKYGSPKKAKKRANNNSKKFIKVSKSKKYIESAALLSIVLGALLIIGMISKTQAGYLGIAIKWIYSITFGYIASFLIPLAMILTGILTFIHKSILLKLKIVIISLITAIIISVFIGTINFTYNIFDQYNYGSYCGEVGYNISLILKYYIGTVGNYLLLLTLLAVLVMYSFNFHLSEMLLFISHPFSMINNFIKKKFHNKKLKEKFAENLANLNFEEVNYDSKENDSSTLPEQKQNKNTTTVTESIPIQNKTLKTSTENNNSKADIEIEKEVLEKEIIVEQTRFKDNYQTPPIKLLDESTNSTTSGISKEELKQKALLLQSKLAEFKIEATIVKINPGPVITQYEAKLPSGVKVSKISSLDKDLAMALKAKSIRIIAPIPGKDTIGIEIPNDQPSVVYLRSVLSSQSFENEESRLAIALGKTISGSNYILDLKKTPHLLIAGATGSGKSVCINGIICSILFRSRPDEVQFCMIDPKKVELSLYAQLSKHHLIAIDGMEDAVATNAEDALKILNALVLEMEKRYEILKITRTRNIQEYNKFLDSGKIQDLEEYQEYDLSKMPYIVCIVDEYGDLMMTSKKAVEEPICRLAQMSRAVGIHLILATQRPSAKIVTGAIKTNFPSRIAFNVMSQIDSRTILDSKGAESLLGKGDMLLTPPGESGLIRIQNAFISTSETKKIVNHIKEQPINFKSVKLETFDENQPDNNIYAQGKDPLYEQAKNLIIDTQMASVSMLQRSLSVGYARAGKIIDQLERDGIIGPHQGSKPRKVLVQN